jgi:hypothetical protein
MMLAREKNNLVLAETTYILGLGEETRKNEDMV